METTHIRVRETSKTTLKVIAAIQGVTMMEMLDSLLKEWMQNNGYKNLMEDADEPQS